MFILTGLVSVAFGVLLFARPGVGALTVALVFGLFSLVYGITRITLGESPGLFSTRQSATVS